jgi:hypothetical protein
VSIETDIVLSAMTDYSAAKHAREIPDEAIIELVRACHEARCDYGEDAGWHGGRPGYGRDPSTPPTSHWANLFDIAKALGNPPDEAGHTPAPSRRAVLEDCLRLDE